MLLSVALLSASLAACGFHPLYGQTGAQSEALTQTLTQIDVDAPGSNVGRQLKFELLDILSAGGHAPANPAYRLSLTPAVYEQDAGVRQDTDVTRKNLLLRTRFILIDVASGEVLLDATSQTRASYNRVQSEFANLSAAEDAVSRSARVIAEDIKMRLGVYFNRQAAL